MADPPATSSIQPDTAMDAELDPEIDMAIDPAPPDPDNPNLEAGTVPEAREPTRKDISLRDFLSKMDDYAPIIPDAVTSHHLLLAGLPPTTTPLPLQRLLALATQKFIADIAADAYQYSRMRTSATGAGQSTAAATNLALQPDQPQQGGKGRDDKGKSGQHVLGVQRPGYGGGGAGGGQAGRAVLTMEDLGCAVGEYGVNVKRGEFYR
ncbi:hypothetical protein N7G274_002871 [Stereocaulon virgatum]|uniref:Transcription initiation factor TFIID subunit 10 n=1 Tax=Stereocaulon virgatum TaxID=373712 RepID=A0ABR4AH48_9LECA